MKIGIRIPGAGPKASPEAIRQTARWAEELGFHSVWVSDHVALPDPDDVVSPFPYGDAGKWPYAADSVWIDPLLVLGLAASVAPSVLLGTSVLVAPLRHPVLLAKQVASLDYLSGGRVMLGIGAGWMREEFELMGVPFRLRGARTAEMVEVMRALWSGQRVVHRGPLYQVDGYTMCPRPSRGTVPIVWGGHSEHALERVASCGDGWHPTQLSLDQLAAGIKRLRGLCGKHGRRFDSLEIVVRPAPVYGLDADIHARHRELGVTHMVIDPPLDGAGDDLSAFRAELERVAALCALTPRSGPA